MLTAGPKRDDAVGAVHPLNKIAAAGYYDLTSIAAIDSGESMMERAPNAVTDHLAKVMFLYWGRRGGMIQFTSQLMKSALADPSIKPILSISRQNEAFESFQSFAPSLYPVDTFTHSIGAITASWRLPGLISSLIETLRKQEVQAVVNLMPHVWSPFIANSIRAKGILFATIIHDVMPHPGDPTAIVNRHLLSEATRADRVITLSSSVYKQLMASKYIQKKDVITLYHPDLLYGVQAGAQQRDARAPLRLLFLGRILPYKGLGLFTEALEILRDRGVDVRIGVFGEGSIELYRERLRALGAEIVNHWLSTDEIACALSRYDAIALSHTESSQSAVAAAAFGAGLPVIATPVGGLVEQVETGRTGVLAKAATPAAFADAIAMMAENNKLYEQCRNYLQQAADTRSMDRFVSDLVSFVVGGRPASSDAPNM